ncbi:YadA-like family protein [Pseudomonas nitroreducens]|uniref:YadA-like family protein n=1 Tax=Pseudomonas nitroreducens TaxID=46680 RepID=UPI001FE317ED|nr:YadA-like family protein [Pseudomonas nitritireducens]
MSVFGFLPEAFAGASFSDTGAAVNGNNGSRAAGSSGGWGAQANYQGLAMTPDGDCQDLTATYTTGPGALGNMSSLFSSLAPQYSTTVDYGSQANKGTGYVNWGSSQFIGGTGNIGNNAGGTAVNNGSTLAYGYNSTAIGCAVRAYGFGSTAMGFGSMAQDSGGIAMGIYSSSKGNGSIAMGTLANAVADHAIALGYGTNASGVDSLALGTSASATAASSLALGTSAVATAGNSVALGANSSTTANLAAAGYNPGIATLSGVASATNGEVSIGASTQERRLTNLAAGSQATDAVNVSQLQSEDAKVENLAATAASALSTTVGTNGAITAPSYLLAKTNTIGGTSGAATNVGAGFDKVDGALGKLDGRVTQNATDSAANAVSIAGLDTRVTQNTADISSNATSIASLGGRMTTAEGNITSLDGRMNNVEGDITSITTNLSSGTIGMVQQSAAGENLTVGKDSDGAAVDFLGSAGARKLINVANGTVAADSQEAVNGGQLFSTNQDVAQNTADIAGNTAAITGLDGRVTQNSSDIASNAASITSLDGRMGSVEGDITSITTNLNSGTIGMVQQSAAGENLTVGKDSDGAAVDFLGIAGARKLINVADGTVAADSQEAVNGGQLFSTNQDVAQNTADIAGNTAAITGIDSRVTNVEGSVTNLDGRMNNVEGDITSITTNLSSGTIGMVQQSAAGENLTVGKDSDGAAVDFLGTAGARKLINVANGTVAADSQEAVNGGQLFSTNQDVAQNTADIAGNTAAITGLDGRVTQNSSDIASNAASITSLDGRMGSVEGDITSITTNLNSGTIGMVQQSAAGENLTVGKDSDGAAVDFLGTAGARKLINVADGTVAADSQEAVNGGQLFNTNQRVEQNATDIAGHTASIGDLNTRTTQNTADIAGNTVAISGLDGRVTQNTTDISGINTTLASMSGTLSDALVYDSAAHDKVTLGSTGKSVQLTNVKAGQLSEDSTDAVNGAQLFDTNNKVAVIDGRVTGLESSVNNIVSGGGIKYFHTSSSLADSVASGANAIAVGGNAKASGDGSVALGEGAEASAKGSVALGQGASDGGRGAPAEAYVGQYSGASNDKVVGTVSVGNAATGETRTISNVADAQEAGDAVNLRQLDGAVAASKSYTDSRVEGIAGSVANVDESIAKVDNRVTQVEDSVSSMGAVNNTAKLQKPTATGTNAVAVAPGAEASGASSTAVGSNAKAKGRNSVAVGANSVAERDNSVAVGSAGNERQITHVAAGVERTDAVNVGQVEDALGSLAGQTNSQFNSLRNDLKEQDDRLSAGIAGAIAIASLPQPMSNGGSTTAAGIGNFNGQSAVSVGVSHVSNDGKWTTKVGGSVDTQSNFSLGAGVGYNW